MKKTFLKKVLATGLMVSTVLTGGMKVSAANNIELYYTYGAPSSANQTVCNSGYFSCGRDFACLNTSTFSVTYTGPYFTIQTTPALNATSFNQSVSYRSIQYKNGVSTKKGTYYDATSRLYNYSGQRTVAIYGTICEAEG